MLQNLLSASVFLIMTINQFTENILGCVLWISCSSIHFYDPDFKVIQRKLEHSSWLVSKFTRKIRSDHLSELAVLHIQTCQYGVKQRSFLLIQSFCSKRKLGCEHFQDHFAEADVMALELCDKLEKIRVRILLQLFSKPAVWKKIPP